MFDWINSTVEDCAVHINEVSKQSTSSVYCHHKGVGNKKVVDKIDKARILATQLRKLKEAKHIAESLTKEGYKIADYYPVSNTHVD